MSSEIGSSTVVFCSPADGWRETVRVGHDRHVGQHDVFLALQAQPQRERRAAAQDGDQRAALEQLGHDERRHLAGRMLDLAHVARHGARDRALARQRQERRAVAAGEPAPGLGDAADAGGIGHVDRLEAVAGDRADVAQRLGRRVVERADEQHHGPAHDGVVAARVAQARAHVGVVAADRRRSRARARGSRSRPSTRPRRTSSRSRSRRRARSAAPPVALSPIL